ncbi:sterol desaturase family protein [Thalassolituus oleivorans]|jgi:sterol desaturase/sphingolipid hydroxylase (fatty acid hydroxylase superfamily)|uniref:sterol desaturase family protein n=1 Tax=Thalassolituus oleivorans TaxID=187493 RepID=UPI000BDD66A6|nr:sterol desaturase family protein [Thalassolituus oleivorans]MCA6127335.1 sterol desaturase [Thalassolituus oleivorans 4BN06-13]PCI49400.1 MAG: sterol desaturase [Oceanospirillales bacterium]
MQDVIHALMFIAAFGVIFGGVMLGEFAWARHKGKTGVYIWRETLANMMTGVSYKVVDGIAVALFIQAFYQWVYQYGFQWNPELSLWSVLAIIVFIDLCFYCAHVLMHKVRWFWNVHVTHHSSEHMNFSTALRQNFTFALSGGWLVWWIPAALVGFDKNWTLIAIEANLVYQFFLHTEQVRTLGPLEKIFNTPSHHRVHHGSNPAQIDTNFGGVFIIWDKLFGTFVAEKDAGEIKYGVTRMPSKPYNAWDLQVHDWLAMFRDIRRYKDLRILYKHPDWVKEHYGE